MKVQENNNKNKNNVGEQNFDGEYFVYGEFYFFTGYAKGAEKINYILEIVFTKVLRTTRGLLFVPYFSSILGSPGKVEANGKWEGNGLFVKSLLVRCKVCKKMLRKTINAEWGNGKWLGFELSYRSANDINSRTQVFVDRLG